jgi:hypothetical protein
MNSDVFNILLIINSKVELMLASPKRQAIFNHELPFLCKTCHIYIEFIYDIIVP